MTAGARTLTIPLGAGASTTAVHYSAGGSAAHSGGSPPTDSAGGSPAHSAGRSPAPSAGRSPADSAGRPPTPSAGGSPDRLLVLAHGAGAGQRHPWMVALATALATRGVDVMTFDFPYMHQGRRVPDKAPILEDCFRAAIDAVQAHPALRPAHLFIGGKSMGGRIATHLGTQPVEGLAGIIALGYPLHPPGKPLQQRTAHLPALTTPLLVIQGERDAFGTPAELAPALSVVPVPVAMHVVSGGDHSLAVRKRPREEVLASVLDAITSWMSERTPH